MFLTGGCGKADNRTVLHSEAFQVDENFRPKKKIISSRFIVVKDGKAYAIDKSRLANTLQQHFNDITRIFDVSDEVDRNWIFSNDWYITFSVETTGGKVYTGFKCLSYVFAKYALATQLRDYGLFVGSCETDDAGGVRLGEGVTIHNLNSIIYRP